MDQITESLGVGGGLLVLFVLLQHVFWRFSKKERAVPSELQKLLYLALAVVLILGIIIVRVRD